jgi:hypothetical protein
MNPDFDPKTIPDQQLSEAITHYTELLDPAVADVELDRANDTVRPMKQALADLTTQCRADTLARTRINQGELSPARTTFNPINDQSSSFQREIDLRATIAKNDADLKKLQSGAAYDALNTTNNTIKATLPALTDANATYVGLIYNKATSADKVTPAVLKAAITKLAPSLTTARTALDKAQTSYDLYILEKQTGALATLDTELQLMRDKSASYQTQITLIDIIAANDKLLKTYKKTSAEYIALNTTNTNLKNNDLVAQTAKNAAYLNTTTAKITRALLTTEFKKLNDLLKDPKKPNDTPKSLIMKKQEERDAKKAQVDHLTDCKNIPAKQHDIDVIILPAEDKVWFFRGGGPSRTSDTITQLERDNRVLTTLKVEQYRRSKAKKPVIKSTVSVNTNDDQGQTSGTTGTDSANGSTT